MSSEYELSSTTSRLKDTSLEKKTFCLPNRFERQFLWPVIAGKDQLQLVKKYTVEPP